MLIRNAQTVNDNASHPERDDLPVICAMLLAMFGEWTTQFLSQLNDDIPMKHHGQLCTILTQLLANMNDAVHSMKK
jgi:carbamate kinase